jgi:type II secretory pathway component PulF
MVYPALLLVVAATVLTMLLLVVVPRFADLFVTLDVPLPGTTELLIHLSDALRNYWWALLAGIAMAVAAVKLYLSTEAGMRLRDRMLVSLPQVGRITRSFHTARITRLLGTLLEGHVPVLDALGLVRGSATNRCYADLLIGAEEAVSRGEPISSAFANSELISPSVCEAIRSGEQSGQVGPLLLNVAGPVILVLLGLLVGFVAVSMFTPLFDLTTMTQGG